MYVFYCNFRLFSIFNFSISFKYYSETNLRLDDFFFVVPINYICVYVILILCWNYQRPGRDGEVPQQRKLCSLELLRPQKVIFFNSVIVVVECTCLVFSCSITSLWKPNISYLHWIICGRILTHHLHKHSWQLDISKILLNEKWYQGESLVRNEKLFLSNGG